MENFPESSSKGTKRRRNEDSDAGNTSSLEDDLTFTDTSVALRIMRAQFPHIQKGSVEPFILKSQLYSSVKDRTQVDRELESLRRDKVLRLFKLNTGQDDHAVMFLDDYLNQCSLLSLGGKVKDSHISVLINAGVLTRQLIDPNMYWFSIPNIGSHLKGIVQGRKEIISLLSRRRYKEMMLSSLEKKRLRTSPLDVRFHLRDLIGSGHLRTDQAPTGLIIRVSKD
ncbi:serine/threonine-protein kinase 19 isoform X10 [Vigna radiata var. radiata]|uniref:Serine/threonine-protein kinase 19 isoform X10 n=1 Tax=Vigna radiata var. radiata TaxID=3916 RepID=A0A3Q0FB32_VIGRR|nr:serine/threonine-protein kinase 19 isoform X10 [Vigna radiata var. radiata]